MILGINATCFRDGFKIGKKTCFQDVPDFRFFRKSHCVNVQSSLKILARI